jgi:tetratricopeptide (TPR) repeat protein
LRTVRTARRKPKAVGLGMALALQAIALIGCLGFNGCRRSVDDSLQRAAEAWDSKDFEVAVREYERYLAKNPSGPKAQEARFQAANIYYLNLHRYEPARALYAELLTQDPNNPNAAVARERLGEVLAELGRIYEAIAEYENIDPSDANDARRIRLRIADLYFDQKNYSQAVTEYAKVVEGDFGYDEYSERAYLRIAAIHVTRGQYRQALPAYQSLTTLSSDPEVRLRAVYGMADCYALMFEYDEAAKVLREVKDEREQPYIARRLAEFDKLKHEAAQAQDVLKR